MHSASNTVDINYKTFIIHVPTGMLQLNMTELNRCDRTVRTTQDSRGKGQKGIHWTEVGCIKPECNTKWPYLFIIYRSFGSLTMTLHSTEADPSLFSAMHIYTPASPILGLLISSWQTPKPQLILYFGLSTISTYFGLKIMLIQDNPGWSNTYIDSCSVTQNQNHTQ